LNIPIENWIVTYGTDPTYGTIRLKRIMGRAFKKAIGMISALVRVSVGISVRVSVRISVRVGVGISVRVGVRIGVKVSVRVSVQLFYSFLPYEKGDILFYVVLFR
jgi:hypothetical protein